MTRRGSGRKAEFRAALALARMTQEDWAKQEDVTPQHVSMVLNGRRESRTLTEKVDLFTAKQLRKVA